MLGALVPGVGTTQLHVRGAPSLLSPRHHQKIKTKKKDADGSQTLSKEARPSLLFLLGLVETFPRWKPSRRLSGRGSAGFRGVRPVPVDILIAYFSI